MHLTPHPTFDTRGGAAAPGEVPLAGDDVGAADVISGLTLVGQHATSHGGGVGGADPAKLDLGEGRAGVIGLNLCTECRREGNQSLPNQPETWTRPNLAWWVDCSGLHFGILHIHFAKLLLRLFSVGFVSFRLS